MTAKAKRSVCKTLVNVFDMAQEMFFTNQADKKLLKRLSQQGYTENYLFELIARENKGETDFDEDERNLLKLFKKFQRFTDKVPFDQDTKDEIVEALIDYMTEQGIEFSPIMVLVVNVLGSVSTNFIALKML
jgi:DNA polymerase III delta prime subunit